MNCAGDQLLAGAGFSGYEDSSVGWRNARNFLAKLANRQAAPGDLRRAFEAHHRVAKPAVLAQKPGVLHRARRGYEQNFRNEGLGDEIKRAAAHARHRKFDCRKRGKKNDGQRRIGLERRREDVQSFAVAHFLVRYDGIECMLGKRAPRVVDAGGLDYFVMLLLEIGNENPPQMRFVICNQYLPHSPSPI